MLGCSRGVVRAPGDRAQHTLSLYMLIFSIRERNGPRFRLILLFCKASAHGRPAGPDGPNCLSVRSMSDAVATKHLTQV